MIFRIMPHFRASYLLIATSPLILIQAATENIDGINFAIPMLIFALIWNLRRNPRNDAHRALLVIQWLAFFVALLKPNDVVCLGLLCFVPSACFGSNLRKLQWIGATITLSTLIWIAWNSRYFNVNIAGWFDPKHPPIEQQKMWLTNHPMDFIRALYSFVRNDFIFQWGQFYGGVGGWISLRLLAFLWGLSRVFFFLLLLMPLSEGVVDRRWAAVSVAQAIVLMLAISITLWIAYGVGDVGHIPYFGGRYLFLVYTFLLVSWSNVISARVPNARNWLLSLGLATNAAGIGAIILSTAIRTKG